MYTNIVPFAKFQVLFIVLQQFSSSKYAPVRQAVNKTDRGQTPNSLCTR